MSHDLDIEARKFADKIQEILNGTITSDIKISVSKPFENYQVLDIAPEGSKIGKFALVPITSFLQEGEEPWLWLLVWYQVKLVGPKKYFGVDSSGLDFPYQKIPGDLLLELNSTETKVLNPIMKEPVFTQEILRTFRFMVNRLTSAMLRVG